MVFDPTKLQALLNGHRLSPDLRHDSLVVAETAAEVRQLLVAAFRDWVDFLFIPTPRPFVVYAEHDEFTTFFAASKSNLNRVTARLAQGGFDVIEGYRRKI